MSDEKLTIELYETLSGGFALGETDPVEGASAGRLRGMAMSLHNAVTITAPEELHRDPEHSAELTVILDYTPFGEGIECYGCVLQLFKPGAPGLRLMIYRFGFEWDDIPYYFEGKKLIHDGSSLIKLWDETTHLYARLYRGHDDRGEQVGAGILQLGIRGVTDLVRTMRVLGRGTAAGRAEILARFGRFFLGELWGAYRGSLPLQG